LRHRDGRLALNFGERHWTDRSSSTAGTYLGYGEPNAEKGQRAKRQ